MPTNNRRSGASNERAADGASERETEHDEDLVHDEDFDPAEYDAMLTLERLESLEEELVDLGVKSLDEVRRRIADLHRELDEELKP